MCSTQESLLARTVYRKVAAPELSTQVGLSRARTSSVEATNVEKSLGDRAVMYKRAIRLRLNILEAVSLWSS